MTFKHWLVSAVGAMAIAWAAPAAQAAPLTGTASHRAVAAQGQSSDIDNIHWRRRCWWHRGHWHCRRHVRPWYPDYYYGGYYPRRHYYYGGRPGFGIYAPGFGLYVGPRYRRHWW